MEWRATLLEPGRARLSGLPGRHLPQGARRQHRLHRHHHSRSHRAQPTRNPVGTISEAGDGGSTGRRVRPRVQQHSDRHHRPQRVPARRAPRGGLACAKRRRDPRSCRSCRIADPAAAGLRPQASPPSRGTRSEPDRSEHGGHASPTAWRRRRCPFCPPRRPPHGEGRRRSDRAGHRQLGDQCARCHARRRTTHGRDRQRHPRRGKRRSAS